MPRDPRHLSDAHAGPLEPASGGPIGLPARPEVIDVHPLPPEVGREAVAEIEANLQAAKSPNTRRAYRAAMNKLVGWVQGHHPEVVRPGIEDPLLSILPLHVATAVDFVSRVEIAFKGETGTLQTRLASTGAVAVYVSAIRAAHRQLRLPDPTADPVFEQAWAGIRRRRGTHQHGKRALRWKLLKRLVDAADDAGALGVKPWSDPRILARDRALLLVGFAGAFRRSELVSFRLGDVRLPLGSDDSLILVLQSSKTSRDPTEVEIPRRSDPYCPVEALLPWLDAVAEFELPGRPSGAEAPLWYGFRSGRALRRGLSAGSVPELVKRLARQAGLRPEEVAELSSHSLRSGAATSAAEAKVEARDIKSLGRWASYSTVDRYIQSRQRGAEHPIARLK